MTEPNRADPIDAVSPPCQSSRAQAWSVFLVCCALAVGVLLVFGQLCGYDFVNLDDEQYAKFNPYVLDGLTWRGWTWAWTSSHMGHWHPLTWISLQIDAQLWGTGPAGFHRTNVLLHLVNTLLVFLVLRRLTGKLWCSAAVAMLFAWHPLRVESVAWISDRKDLLGCCFGLLALLAYTRFVERSDWRWFVTTLLLFAASLLAKAVWVGFPVILMLLDFWPLRRWQAKGWQRLLPEKLPFMLLSAAVCAATVWAARMAGSINALATIPTDERFRNVVVAHVQYLVTTLCPTNLACWYPYPRPGWAWPTAILAASVLTAISFLAVQQVRRRPYLLVGWAWFLVTLLPVTGVVPSGAQARADRYMYLPHMGLFLLVVWGAAEACRRWRAGVVAAGVVLLIASSTYGWLAWRQAQTWRNSVALWTQALAVTDNNAMAHNNLGVVLHEQGDGPAARQHFESALQIEPRSAMARVNLGRVHYGQGEHEEAVRCWRAALQLESCNPDAHTNLGMSLRAQGRIDEARGHFEQALAVEPGNEMACSHLASILGQQGHSREAEAHLRRMIDLYPRSALGRYKLGLTLTAQNRMSEAEAELTKAIELCPQPTVQFYQALAHVQLLKGDRQAATETLGRAIQARPNSARLHYDLGTVLKDLGQEAEAARSLYEALRLDPTLAPALYELGLILKAQGMEEEAERCIQKAKALVRQPGPRSPLMGSEEEAEPAALPMSNSH